MEQLDELKRLLALHDALKRGPQSPGRELEAALLKFEITVMENHVESLLATRAALLLRAWRKTGQATAINSAGQRRTARPVMTTNEVQNARNLISEIKTLAAWSYGVSPWWF